MATPKNILLIFMLIETGDILASLTPNSKRSELRKALLLTLADLDDETLNNPELVAKICQYCFDVLKQEQLITIAEAREVIKSIKI
jgi:hypothetical protein